MHKFLTQTQQDGSTMYQNNAFYVAFFEIDLNFTNWTNNNNWLIFNNNNWLICIETILTLL